MVVVAVVEVALHFESFRNIDLFHQGLYHLKARICFDGSQGAAVAAKPCGQLSGSAVNLDGSGAVGGTRQAERTDHHNLIPAHIIDEHCTFSTRSFLIRYCEEEVEVNEIGQFRIEVPVDQLGETPPMTLEVDLMFADLTRHGGPDSFGENPDVDSTEFKSVSTCRLAIRNLHAGVHEFCPIVFDEYHFCLTNVMLHSVLLDHRFRLPHLEAARPGGGDAIGRGGAGAGGTEDGDGGKGGDGGPLRRLSTNGALAAAQGALAAPVALSLAEGLFRNSDVGESREQLLCSAEAFYKTYLGPLVVSHRELVSWLRDICDQCVTKVQHDFLVGTGGPPEMPEELLALARDGAAADGRPAASSASKASPIRTRLEQRLGPVTSRRVAESLLADLNVASCRTLETWHLVLSVLLHVPREIGLRLREVWEKRIALRWGTSVAKDGIRGDVACCGKSEVCSKHPVLSDSMRKNTVPADVQAADVFCIQDMVNCPPLQSRPIIFEERYSGGGAASARAPPKNRREQSPRKATAGMPMEMDDCSPSAPKTYHGVHLMVLVHGFQGNSFDMRLMKNNLSLLYPDSMFLSSTCNEDNTEGDVSDMGIRLAQEVVNYICDWCPGSALGRLSFVAHSLGGLIVRAALPLLTEYSSKMYTFLSFSTSHLGIFGDRISLFNTGFWMLKKWRNSTFLQQVSMSDHDNPRETFLYKLSKSRGFELFQNVVLASCYEDQYGPMQSARAEVHPDWEGAPDKEVYREMVDFLWAPVRPERVRRLDVNFVILEKNLDSFIGRTAHIQFLECQPMMKMLVHKWSALFR